MAQQHASTDMESLSETDAMVELLPSSDQRLFTRRMLSKTALAVVILLGLALACVGGSFKLARAPASSRGSDYIGLAGDPWGGLLSDDAMKQMNEASSEQASGLADGTTDAKDTTAASEATEEPPTAAATQAPQAPAAAEVSPNTIEPPATEPAMSVSETAPQAPAAAEVSPTTEPPATEVPTATEPAMSVSETANAPQTKKTPEPELDPLMAEAANTQVATSKPPSSATAATAAAVAVPAAAAGTAAAAGAAAGASTAAVPDATTMAETMMVGQAGKVANVMAQKAEATLEAKLNEKPQKCTGPNCCLGSTCMGVPGMQCKGSRGTTSCVGSNAFSLQEGMCRCVTGPCNVGGFCPDAPKIGGKSPGGGTIPSAPAAPATTAAAAAAAATPAAGSASAPTEVSTPWSR